MRLDRPLALWMLGGEEIEESFLAASGARLQQPTANKQKPA
jgi:hypothetical protein